MPRFNQFPFDVPQVALDYGFTDTSYRNDVSASMTHDQLKLVLWVDFPSREDREYVEYSRFTIYRGELGDVEDNPCFEAETEDELRAYLSGLGMVPVAPQTTLDADALIRRIHGWLGDQYTIGDRAMCDKIADAVNGYLQVKFAKEGRYF